MSHDLSGLHKCNTTTIQVQYRNFFLYCSCVALVRTPAIQCCKTNFLQLIENLQATCSSCQKTCIAVVLRLCGLLQYNKIFVLCYCSCIVVVLHLCGPLYCCTYIAFISRSLDIGIFQSQILSLPFQFRFHASCKWIQLISTDLP